LILEVEIDFSDVDPNLLDEPKPTMAGRAARFFRKKS
jgi:hypothetical protein